MIWQSEQRLKWKANVAKKKKQHKTHKPCQKQSCQAIKVQIAQPNCDTKATTIFVRVNLEQMLPLNILCYRSQKNKFSLYNNIIFCDLFWHPFWHGRSSTEAFFDANLDKVISSIQLATQIGDRFPMTQFRISALLAGDLTVSTSVLHCFLFMSVCVPPCLKF